MSSKLTLGLNGVYLLEKQASYTCLVCELCIVSRAFKAGIVLLHCPTYQMLHWALCLQMFSSIVCFLCFISPHFRTFLPETLNWCEFSMLYNCRQWTLAVGNLWTVDILDQNRKRVRSASESSSNLGGSESSRMV